MDFCIFKTNAKDLCKALQQMDGGDKNYVFDRVVVSILLTNFVRMIKFGTRVICINDVFTEEQKAMIPYRPVKDHQYTIDEILITRRGKAVTLVELDNPPLMHPSGAGTFIPSFDINRFKEIEELSDAVVKEELQVAEVQ